LPDDLQVGVYVPGQSVAAWLTNVQRSSGPAEEHAGRPAGDRWFSAARLEARGEGVYAFRAPADDAPIYLLIDHPGYLRAFQAGPFETPADETIEVELPVPATLHVTVAPR